MSTFRLEPNGFIYLRLWHKSKPIFKKSTGLKIEESKWDSNRMRPKSSRYTFNGLNVSNELIRHQNALQDAWNYFKTSGGLTSEKLKSKYLELLSTDPRTANTKNKKKFLQFFADNVKQYKESNSRYWKGYSNAYNHLTKYFGTKSPEFDDIDMSFYILYNKYLEAKKLSVNSISDHWKNIKAMMNEAYILRLHSNEEYKQFKRKNEQSDTVFLSVEELDKIYNLDLKGYLNTARDYFIVGCFTGLRFSDWHKIEKSKIKDGAITIITEKTGKKVNIPIHEKVIDTLDKYDDGKLLKKPSNQKMNEYIKKVVMKAGIDESIDTRITKGGKMILSSKPKYALVSTHTARRSFATNLTLAGTSPYLIMKITGHKSLPSFEKYIRLDDLDATNQLKQIEFFKWRDKKSSTKLTKQQKLLLLLK